MSVSVPLKNFLGWVTMPPPGDGSLTAGSDQVGPPVVNSTPLLFEAGGAKGDGVTDDSGAIVLAYQMAVAQGRPLAGTPGKSYGISNRIDLSAALQGVTYPPAIRLDGVTLVQNASTYLFYASATSQESTKTAMTTAINAGDTTITLPSGGGAAFSVGSYVAVQCLAGVFGLPGTGGTGFLGYPREIKEVIAISGDVLTVDSPYVFAYPITATPYSVGNSAYYSKINPLVAPEITGGRFTNPNLAGLEAGTQNGYLARWEQCRNVRMFDIVSDQMGGGILCLECIGIKITADLNRHQYQNDPNNPGSYGVPWGYGVALDGCCRDGELDLTGRACRHIYTTLGNNFSGANTPGSGGGSDPNSPDGQWYIGGPMNILVRGVGEGDAKTAAVWDTHPYGYGHDFDVRAIGGQVGFQCRDLKTTGRVVAVQQTVTSGVSVINGAQSTDLTVDVSGVCGTAAKAVAIDGTDTTIRGRIHDNLCGIGVAFSSTATRPVLSADIINNQGTGVSDLGATSPTVYKCRIPKSTSQIVSIANLGATGKVMYCDLSGYGGGQAGLNSINAAALIHACATDSGLANSVQLWLGATGGTLSFDAGFYRGAANLIRTAQTITTDKTTRWNLNTLISGKTSAQIDTEFGTAGISVADGMVAVDTTNHLAAVRLGGSWYTFTLAGPL